MDKIVKSVDTLAKEANEAAAASQTYAVNSIQKAIEAGRALNQAKSQLPDGAWIAWLESNWDYTRQWANKLQKLADNASKLETEGAETIKEALRIVAKAEKRLEPRKNDAMETAVSMETDPEDDPPSEAHQPKEGEEYDDWDPCGGEDEDDEEPPFDVGAEPVSPSEAARSIADQFFQKLPTEQSLGYLSRAIDDYQKHNPEGRKCRLIHDELAIMLQAILAARKAWRTWK